MRHVFFAHFFFFISVFAKDSTFFCEQGNLSLPPSQQVGPLISFGQNIIQANAVQLIFFGNEFIGEESRFLNLLPGILWGVTDDFSIYLTVPFAAHFRQNNARSRGLEDIILQFEYNIFSKLYSCSSDMITIVANASFPTGSSRKTPPTGNGSMSYFAGITYSRLWSDWYVFTSYGAQFPTKHARDKVGNQYLYQAGTGYNFWCAHGWIFDGLVEINGTFFEKNRVQGSLDPNSGGNLIYVTPSLWASSEHWVFQGGFGFVIQENLFGTQNKPKYLWSANVDYTF